MKIGLTLPQFRKDASAALAAARAADEDDRFDGLFAFDHLWAIGQPHKPSLAIWPLLGALAGATERIVLGSFVARAGLMPDALLAHQVSTMVSLAGSERFIAGLGMGDELSHAENEALGVPFPPADERLRRLENCARLCTEAGAEVWLGGRSAAIAALARRLDVTLNLWGSPTGRVAREAQSVTVTWGGVVTDDRRALGELIEALRVAGATWLVMAPPYRLEEPPQETVKRIGDAIDAA